MTDIGRSMTGLEGAGQPMANPPLAGEPVRSDMPHVAESAASKSAAQKATGHRKHSLWESLTASLDLACRGYLCMQIVDCDPVSDPDCSAGGTKVVLREVPGMPAASATPGEHAPERAGSEPLQRSS